MDVAEFLGSMDNPKVGMRVRLKIAIKCGFTETIPIGTEGTIVVSSLYCITVRWDETAYESAFGPAIAKKELEAI